MKFKWKWIVSLVLMLLLVIFAAQNYQTVTLNFFFWTFKVSRAIVIFIAFAIGFITSSLVFLYERTR